MSRVASRCKLSTVLLALTGICGCSNPGTDAETEGTGSTQGPSTTEGNQTSETDTSDSQTTQGPGTSGPDTQTTTQTTSTGETDSGSSETDSETATTGEPVCPGTNFDNAPAQWSIPYPANVLANGYHAVLDIDGDHLPDFVQYDGESSSNDPDIGVQYWLNFANTGSAFTGNGAQWTIPYPANVLSNGYHAVLDFDNDHLPDFIQYDAESTSNDPAIGVDYWLLFTNEGNGFATSDIKWPIPYAANVLSNGYHAVLDMTGDGLPDFVQYDGEASSNDPEIGNGHWLVFENTGSGFAQTGTTWVIPYPANVLSNGYHTVLDMNNDQLPDFVQYDAESTSNDPSIGTDFWLVFENTGSGFATTGAQWSIPYPANVLSNGYHAVLDMTGDGLPDFTQYDAESTSNDPSIGTDVWLVFENDGSGFAGAGQQWSIPYPANVLSNGYHSVLDMRDDGLPDFVQYDAESSSNDPSIGVDVWLVFDGMCNG